MTDILALVTDVFAFTIFTVGGTAITLGLVLAGVLVIGLAASVFRRFRGRG